jgi:antitoxin ParD1/3/4
MGDIKLNEQFEEIIRRQMETGRYGSASEVVAAGLTLLAGFEEVGVDDFEALRAGINDAFDDTTDDIPVSSAFESVERLYAADKADKRA